MKTKTTKCITVRPLFSGSSPIFAGGSPVILMPWKALPSKGKYYMSTDPTIVLDSLGSDVFEDMQRALYPTAPIQRLMHENINSEIIDAGITQMQKKIFKYLKKYLKWFSASGAFLDKNNQLFICSRYTEKQLANTTMQDGMHKMTQDLKLNKGNYNVHSSLTDSVDGSHLYIITIKYKFYNND